MDGWNSFFFHQRCFFFFWCSLFDLVAGFWGIRVTCFQNRGLLCVRINCTSMKPSDWTLRQLTKSSAKNGHNCLWGGSGIRKSRDKLMVEQNVSSFHTGFICITWLAPSKSLGMSIIAGVWPSNQHEITSASSILEPLYYLTIAFTLNDEENSDRAKPPSLCEPQSKPPHDNQWTAEMCVVCIYIYLDTCTHTHTWQTNMHAAHGWDKLVSFFSKIPLLP